MCVPMFAASLATFAIKIVYLYAGPRRTSQTLACKHTKRGQAKQASGYNNSPTNGTQTKRNNNIIIISTYTVKYNKYNITQTTANKHHGERRCGGMRLCLSVRVRMHVCECACVSACVCLVAGCSNCQKARSPFLLKQRGDDGDSDSRGRLPAHH